MEGKTRYERSAGVIPAVTIEVPMPEGASIPRPNYSELIEEFESLVNQIDNSRICYFGTHTGRQVQFSSGQIEHWRSLINRAKR